MKPFTWKVICLREQGFPPLNNLNYKKVYFLLFLDVLNVSGRFNTKDTNDVTNVGDDNTGEPYFELRTSDGKSGSPQNVSALIGKTAFLSCVVKNLGKSKSVCFYEFLVIYIYITFIHLSKIIIEFLL